MNSKKKKLQPIQNNNGHSTHGSTKDDFKSGGQGGVSPRQRKVTFDENDCEGPVMKDRHQKSRRNSDTATKTSPREKGHQVELNQVSLRKRKDTSTSHFGLSGHSGPAATLESPPYAEFKNLSLSPQTEDFPPRRLSNPDTAPSHAKDASFPSINVQDAECSEKPKFKELSSPRLQKKEASRASIPSQASHPHRRIDISALPLEGAGERLAPSAGINEESQKHMRRYTFSGDSLVDASLLPPSINRDRRKSSELDLPSDRSGATSPWSRPMSPSQKLFSSHQNSQPEKKFPVRLEPLQRERSRTTSK